MIADKFIYNKFIQVINCYLFTDNTMSFSAVFEPALLKEIYQFGEIKYFKEGDIIMDYG